MQRLFTLFIVLSLSSSVLVKAIAHKKSTSHRANKKMELHDTTIKHPGFYAGFGLGWSGAEKFKERVPYINGRPDTKSPTFNIHGGYKINQHFRVDLNAQYRKFEYDPKAESAMLGTTQFRQKIDNYSVFINGYADLVNKSRFTPYVTAGIGFSHNAGKDLSITSSVLASENSVSPGDSETDFAWNVGVGSRIKIDALLDLDLSYRYLDLGKVKVRATKTAGINGVGARDVAAGSQDLKSHQILLNLNYHF